MFLSSGKKMLFANVNDYEEYTKKHLSTGAYDFARGGAANELSMNWNRTAFQNIRIRPRILRNISERSMTTNLLGNNLDMPIGIAPTGIQKMLHPSGEMAMAKAAATYNTIFIMSTVASTSFEEITSTAPTTHKWFQLYLFYDRKISEEAIRKVELCGFEAIVLTVDMTAFGIRYRNLRNQFEVLPEWEFVNFPQIKKYSEGPNEQRKSTATMIDSSMTWDTVKWLINFTKLPVILKGILTPEDAIIAADIGCKGIIVSNHGGRQLDTVASSIEALPAIAKAVGHRLTVMMDGGITQGTDIFKAIALGAKMIFVGRAPLWGLATNGQQGVEDILNILKNELDTTMALAGTRHLNEITQDYIFSKRVIV